MVYDVFGGEGRVNATLRWDGWIDALMVHFSFSWEHGMTIYTEIMGDDIWHTWIDIVIPPYSHRNFTVKKKVSWLH